MRASTTSTTSSKASQLRQAAQAGDADAMWRYALLLLGPSAPPAVPGQSLLRWLLDLAKTLEDGAHAEARDWVWRASEAGNTQAMVVQAIGLERADRDNAERLLGQAADRGDTTAMLYLGTMRERDGDQEAAKDWFGKLAGLGDSAGMAKLGEMQMAEDPAAARDWLAKAAAAGNVGAQSDLAVAASGGASHVLDPAHPPAQDPRQTGVFGPRTPVSRRGRVVADCVKCGRKTVQDIFDVIVSAWFGVGLRHRGRGLTTEGKAGQRARFSACAVCGCLYPVDAAARQFVQAKGGEFFNPAKLPPERRARAARAMRNRLPGQASVLAIILGLVAFFAAPLVWGILAILLGLASYRGQPRRNVAVAAIVIAVLGTVIGTVLHHAHPFGYG
jgi:TPR repeat protein